MLYDVGGYGGYGIGGFYNTDKTHYTLIVVSHPKATYQLENIYPYSANVRNFPFLHFIVDTLLECGVDIVCTNIYLSEMIANE